MKAKRFKYQRHEDEGWVVLFPSGENLVELSDRWTGHHVRVLCMLLTLSGMFPDSSTTEAFVDKFESDWERYEST